jgi:hypothetical protein
VAGGIDRQPPATSHQPEWEGGDTHGGSAACVCVLSRGCRGVGAGVCGGASPEEIVARLEAEGSPWSEKTLQTLRRQSPISVKITCAPASACCCADFVCRRRRCRCSLLQASAQHASAETPADAPCRACAPHTHTHTHARVLTEIYLCGVCSCQEILRRATHTRAHTQLRGGATCSVHGHLGGPGDGVPHGAALYAAAAALRLLRGRTRGAGGRGVSGLVRVGVLTEDLPMCRVFLSRCNRGSAAGGQGSLAEVGKDPARGLRRSRGGVFCAAGALTPTRRAAATALNGWMGARHAAFATMCPSSGGVSLDFPRQALDLASGIHIHNIITINFSWAEGLLSSQVTGCIRILCSECHTKPAQNGLCVLIACG